MISTVKDGSFQYEGPVPCSIQEANVDLQTFNFMLDKILEEVPDQSRSPGETPGDGSHGSEPYQVWMDGSQTTGRYSGSSGAATPSNQPEEGNSPTGGHTTCLTEEGNPPPLTDTPLQLPEEEIPLPWTVILTYLPRQGILLHYTGGFPLTPASALQCKGFLPLQSRGEESCPTG